MLYDEHMHHNAQTHGDHADHHKVDNDEQPDFHHTDHSHDDVDKLPLVDADVLEELGNYEVIFGWKIYFNKILQLHDRQKKQRTKSMNNE